MSPDDRPTVLIVDDDSDMRRYCGQALQSEGYATISCADGLAALEVLGRQPIRLLLTDFQLGPAALRFIGGPRRIPVLNGVGLMRRALASHPGLRVVLITAYGDHVLRAEGFDLSRLPLLHKPFDPDSLRRVVRGALQQEPVPQMQSGTPGCPWIRRAHRRFPLSYPVFFSGRVDGHGLVANLSVHGCQIESSCLIRPDTYLTVVITLPGGLPPLKIDVAVVRWAKPGVFGMEFRYMEQEAGDRLAGHLSTLTHEPG